ncbi:MAG: type II toxin-antitoxin system HicA family toxin [Candidatus Berkelbacteria bacterium]|nr:type II toxin-antitoxin system HicA family toxin [Candidatus Berkelbacteria bacterium]
MPHLTPINKKKFNKFLFAVGCKLERTKGDHRIYWRADLKRPVVITEDKIVPVFIIRNNLRTLGMSPDEYVKILENI